MAFAVRRVVIGLDGDGKEAVLSDGPPPGRTGPDDGPAFSTVLWLGEAAITAQDGGDAPDGPFSLEPPIGGLCSRVIRLPPPAPGITDNEAWLRLPGDDPKLPGMHTTDTLDLMVVLDGEMVLGLDDGDHHLGPGDVAIQRGTAHRWRVTGTRPCTYAVTMLRSNPAGPTPSLSLAVRHGSETADIQMRRVVTGSGDAGTSYAMANGTPPVVLRPRATTGSLMADMWQTGGPVVSCDQGGDIPGHWELDPAGMGVAFRMVEWPPQAAPSAHGWHATSSIDVDFILSGHMELEVRDHPTLQLGPGDVVVLRGCEHLWRPVGDVAVRMAAVMIGIDQP